MYIYMLAFPKLLNTNFAGN